MSRLLRNLILPLAILGAAAAIAMFMVNSRAELPKRERNNVMSQVSALSNNAMALCALLAAALTDLAENPAQRSEMAEAAYARLVADFGVASGISRLKAKLAAMLGSG